MSRETDAVPNLNLKLERHTSPGTPFLNVNVLAVLEIEFKKGGGSGQRGRHVKCRELL